MVNLLLEFIFELVSFVADENFVEILVFSKSVDDCGERIFFVLKVLPQLVHGVFELEQSLVVKLFFFHPELLFNEEKCVFIKNFLIVLLGLAV